MNFYKEKSTDLPRFLYSNLLKAVLQATSVNIVQTASQFVSNTKSPPLDGLARS